MDIPKVKREQNDLLDCRGLSHFEKFWFNKIININKVSEKLPATSDPGVMRKMEIQNEYRINIISF